MKKHMKLKFLNGAVYLASGLTGSFLFLNGPAAAQQLPDSSGDGPRVEEITVIAQKRSENLQRVPVAVTAVSSEKLQALSISSSQDLAVVTPGLVFPAAANFAQPHIRGVGSGTNTPGAENSVAIYVDGVYLASPSAGILNLANASQIEVLKGPQGTLFGRNATGGLIQVRTLDPASDTNGYVHLGYGNYKTISADAYVSGGLAENLSANLAFQVLHQGEGFGTNLTTGEDIYQTNLDLSVRGKLKWVAGDNTSILVSADYARNENSQFGNQTGPSNNGLTNTFPNATRPSNPYDSRSSLTPGATNKSGGASLKIEQDLGFAQLSSLTAYRDQKLTNQIDGDLGADPLVDIHFVSREKQFSQEFQLQSKSGSAIQWTAGLFYMRSKSAFDPFDIDFAFFSGPPVFGAPAGGPPPLLGFQTFQRTESKQVTDALAGYVQATAELGANTRVTAGVRYSYEKRKFDVLQTGRTLLFTAPFPPPSSVVPGTTVPGVVDTRFSTGTPTWRIAVDHSFTPDILGYVSYNRGFKSGGFNLASVDPNPYFNEKLDAYEAGIKSKLFDNRVKFNISAFYYKYDNVQLVRYILATPLVLNGAKAKLYGAEIDTEIALSNELTISGGLSLLKSEFTDFPCAQYFAGTAEARNAAVALVPASSGCQQSPIPGALDYLSSAKGNRLPYAPNYAFNIGATYGFDVGSGKVQANVNYSRTGQYFSESDNVLEQKAYDIVNASLSWETGDGLNVKLWGKNLTDKAVVNQLASSPNFTLVGYAPPRTYGVTLGFKY